MEIKNVSIIGGGTMGNGIAHVFAQKGFNVNLVEMSSNYLERAIATISKNLDRQVKKQVITEDEKSQTLGRINKIVGVENTPADSDLVIEAIYEDRDAKIKIFSELENLVNKN